MKDKLTQLREECSELYSEIDLNSLLQKIAEKIKNFLECAESSIFLYNPVKEELYFEIVTGDKSDELKQIILTKGEGVVGWIAENKKSVIINDCARDPRFTSVTDIKTDFKTHSITGVPVQMGEKLLGVLEAINKKKGGFDERDKELLEYISNFVAIPLQNALLFRKVTQETREKARLIELGKTISYSSNLEEIFQILKEIIMDLINPLEINVMVKSQNQLYNLMKNKKISKSTMISNTNVDKQTAVFPLRSRNKTLGFLQIKVDKQINDEIASLIKGISVFVAISIEKFEMFTQMLEKERMEKELHIAREIQQSFLLKEKIMVNGLEVDYINIPSSAVGGDYYDIVKLNEDETIFTINDISGHGVPASLLMSIFRANFIYRIKKDKNILTTINHLNNLIAETTETNLYVTSFTGLLNRKDMFIRYINAGHIPPIIVRDKKIIELKDGGLVLGMFPDSTSEIVEFALKQNDLIVLFTDGIIEAENKVAEQFSLQRFTDFFKSNCDKDIGFLKKKIIQNLQDFVEDESFEDDVTFMLIRVV
jgi:sigma-B regulation protein RsbU (phosphoserine phosphatase)